MLNSSKKHDVDRELRRHVPIPEHEVVSMMIAVGHLPDEFEVAHPPMKPVDAAFASQP